MKYIIKGNLVTACCYVLGITLISLLFTKGTGGLIRTTILYPVLIVHFIAVGQAMVTYHFRKQPINRNASAIVFVCIGLILTGVIFSNSLI